MRDHQALRAINVILDRYIAGDMEMVAAMSQIAYVSGRYANLRRQAAEVAE